VTYTWPRLLIILVVLIPLVLALLTACSSLTVINAITPSKGYTVSKNIGYGASERQQLDVYMPSNAHKARPVVVFFYGGRWSSGSKDDYLFVAQALTSRGFVVVMPDYRLYPQVKFPSFVEDGAQAVAWTRNNITLHGGNPEQIFIMGHSAGAHIAAMLALDKHFLQNVGGSTDWLAGMIGLAGPYDFLPLTDADLKDMFGPPERYAQSQPITFVDGSEPPLLLLHGFDDKIVWLRNTRNLSARVREKGGQVETIFYEDLGHFTLLGTLASTLKFKASVVDDVTAFINKNIGTVEGRTLTADKAAYKSVMP
jgi:acetyl esterase/lipase